MPKPTPLTPSELEARLESMRESVRNALVAGVETNMGTFTHFDSRGTAHFTTKHGVKGWTGAKALHFVQVLK